MTSRQHDVLLTVRVLYFESYNWPVHVTAICKKAHMARSTAYKHLSKLVEMGLIEQAPDKQGWRPSTKESDDDS